MTRIFEALKKTQPAPAAVPFPPPPPAKAGPGPSAPAQLQTVLGRAAAAVARSEPEPTAVPETVVATRLPADVVRELAGLRVNLEAALDERTTRVVLFMSSVGHEGTTTVASQFASLLANDPRLRVLVLDLNPRRPALASRFGRDAARGRGEAGDDEPRLALMRLAPHSPGAGVAAIAARALITSVAGSYDWIIADGPPILDAPEMTDIAPLADGVVLVVRSGHTKRPVVSRAVDLLRKSGARVVGTVLNRRRLEIPGFLYRRI
jgi:Mrp family chromosome partitioning ATPase